MQFRLVLAPAIILGAAACGSSTKPNGPHVDGTTQGWFNGSTGTLSYTRTFACPMPPAAHSASGCEVGAAAATSPTSGAYSSGSVPPIYLLVPLYTPGPPAS